MPAQQDFAECPVCATLTPVQCVTRLNVDEDAKYLAQVVNLTINEHTCPACGHSGVVAEPVYITGKGDPVGYMPVSVPPNRKARIVRRMENRLRDLGAHGECRICFGPLQLRKTLPSLPWKGRVPQLNPRFDVPGPAYRRVKGLRTALADDPDNTLLATRLGGAYYDQRDYKRARKTLETVLKTEPKNFDALFCMGSIAMETRDYQAALVYYDRAVGASHEPLPRFMAGQAAFHLEDYKGARERLRVAVREDTNLLEAQIWLARACIGMNDYAGALSALWQAVEHGLNDARVIKKHREFEQLESDPQFKSILTKMRKAGERKKAGDRRRESRHTASGDGHTASGDGHTFGSEGQSRPGNGRGRNRTGRHSGRKRGSKSTGGRSTRNESGDGRPRQSGGRSGDHGSRDHGHGARDHGKRGHDRGTRGRGR